MPQRLLVAAAVLLAGVGAACTSRSDRATAPYESGTPTARPTSAGPIPPHPSASPVQVPGDLAARWWAWAASAPAERNPVIDHDGRHCAQSQPADVWFLAGTSGGTAFRSCTVPAGRPVFVPVVNTVCPVLPGQEQADAVRRCASTVDEAAAELDGTALPVRTLQSGTFELRPSAGNPLFESGAAGFAAVGWGQWVGPVVISPGRHELHIRGRSGTFTTDVTYELRVR